MIGLELRLMVVGCEVGGLRSGERGGVEGEGRGCESIEVVGEVGALRDAFLGFLHSNE